MQTCIYFNLTFVVEMAGAEPNTRPQLHLRLFGRLQRDRVALSAVIVRDYRLIIVNPDAADERINNLPLVRLVIDVAAFESLQKENNLLLAKGGTGDLLFLDALLQVSLLRFQFQ